MGQGIGAFYRLTAEGRALWSRRAEVDMPEHYSLVLGLVESCGHWEVIRSRLMRHPQHAVDAWLREFEQLRLIEAGVVAAPGFADLIGRASTAPALPESESERIAEDARFADISLSRLGVYVAHERVTNRLPWWKNPNHTHVMVVDDDPDQLALAVLRLATAGYPVQTATGVASLLQLLQKRRPDALLLDVMLADGDGFQVLAALRQHPAYALLPIVMVTAKSEPDSIAKGLALGADAYVTKPYGKTTLDYVLRYVLQQEAPQAAAPAAMAEPAAEEEKTAAPAPTPPAAPPARPDPAPQAVISAPGEEAERLKTRNDVHALLTEVFVHREAQQAQNAARWRTVKRAVLALTLALAFLQFYMMDTLYRIASLEQVQFFVPAGSRDLRSANITLKQAPG